VPRSKLAREVPDVEEWKRPPAAVMVQTVIDAVRPGSMIGFHNTAGEETRKAVDESLRAFALTGTRSRA
jgi:hypothetical protein